MNNMNLRYFLVFLFILMTSCSGNPQKPDNLIEEEKYTDLLVELQLIRSYSENAATDSTTIDSLTSLVFQKYEVTNESFRESHRYYQQFPEEQKIRTDKAIERLKMDNVEEDSVARDTLPAN